MKKQRQATLGLDFGTESVRAIVVDCTSGEEIAVAVDRYADQVITQTLPKQSALLPAHFALQNPQNYLESMATVLQAVLAKVSAQEIIGIGIDFTACTMLPVRRDGTPLCQLEQFQNNPHAWVKLWKHHAAQPQADRINELAVATNQEFLKYYGGQVSSEWMLPKCLETYQQAPQVFAAADFFVDAGDWIVFQLTGEWSRSTCTAGYKGFWSAEEGYVKNSFLEKLAPGFSEVIGKWSTHFVAPGREAGRISALAEKKWGLLKNTHVSAASIDAHSGVPGMGVYRSGVASLIMGTSTCHMLLDQQLTFFNGFAGVVKDGILPGFYGYESGQPAVGDLFNWYANKLTGKSFQSLANGAKKLAPASSGVVCLDWINGNRNIFMNSNLSGNILGIDLQTTPESLYQAMVEATAFGTQIILASYQKAQIAVNEIVVCGGLTQDDYIMQTYADVLQKTIKVAASEQAVALGSAIFGAMAANPNGAAETIITQMTKPSLKTYQPRAELANRYADYFAIYNQVHDYFGLTNPDIMKKLKQLKK